LVLAKRDQNDVAVVDPDLFPQLAANETQTLDTVEALRRRSKLERYGGALRGVDSAYHGLQAAVTQHLEDLSVLLAIFLERELTLLVAESRGSIRAGSGRRGRGRESYSFSFFPLLRFLPPFPLFFGILAVAKYAVVLWRYGDGLVRVCGFAVGNLSRLRGCMPTRGKRRLL
jgi:hypothetical protein